MQLTDSAALAAVGVVSLADSDTVAVENTDLARWPSLLYHYSTYLMIRGRDRCWPEVHQAVLRSCLAVTFHSQYSTAASVVELVGASELVVEIDSGASAAAAAAAAAVETAVDEGSLAQPAAVQKELLVQPFVVQKGLLEPLDLGKVMLLSMVAAQMNCFAATLFASSCFVVTNHCAATNYSVANHAVVAAAQTAAAVVLAAEQTELISVGQIALQTC